MIIPTNLMIPFSGKIPVDRWLWPKLLLWFLCVLVKRKVVGYEGPRVSYSDNYFDETGGETQPKWCRVPVETVVWPEFDRPTPKPVSFVVEMESETFGTDVFFFDSRQALHEGICRLVDNALVWSKKDGLGRSFTVAHDVPEVKSDAEM